MDQDHPIEPLEPQFAQDSPARYPAVETDWRAWLRRPRGYTAFAWIVIAVMSLITIGVHLIPMDEGEGNGNEKDVLGVGLMELQAKYLVGAANAPGMSAGNLNQYGTLDDLAVGTVDQRIRHIILLAEVEGAEAAHEAIQQLDDDIVAEIERTKAAREAQRRLEEEAGEAARNVPSFELTESQTAVLEALRKLYDGAESPNVDALSDAERDLLVDELGWFGELALTPRDAVDTDARRAVMKPAVMIFYVALGGFLALIGVGLVGFIALVILIVLSFTGRVRSNFTPTPVHHGLYAETFAAWMVGFLGFQVVGGVVGWFVPEIALLAVGLAFFGSLVVLGWPVLRGVPWRQVRLDTGLMLGTKPAVEPIIGVGGYISGLPIFAVGVVMTLTLLLIQQEFTPTGPLFEPAGGPAHPIIEEVIGSNWWVRVQLLFLGSVAAPIVEETMFRGVLYRHLRDATGRFGVLMSIAASTLINAFIFAIIHPQGWVAVPALMALAINFSLAREWRGSLIPCMVMHGIQNFLVFSLLMFALSV